MCCNPPEPPDTTAMADANREIAERQFELQQEQFDWFKENSRVGMEIATEVAREAISQGRWSRAEQREAMRIADEQRELDRGYETGAREFADTLRTWMGEEREAARALEGQATGAREEAAAIRTEAAEDRDAGKRLRARYDAMFAPLEGQYLAEVQDLLSPEAQEMARARAGSQVAQAFEAQRRNADQRLRSMGIDPSQGRSVNDRTLDIAQAAAQSQAMNEAADRSRAEGREAALAGINMGRQYWDQARGLEQQSQGLRSQAIASENMALNTGNQAIARGGQALNYGQQGLGYDTAAMRYGDRALGLTGAAQNWGSQALSAGQGATGAYNQASQTGANVTNSARGWGQSAISGNQSAAGILNQYGQSRLDAHSTPLLDLGGMALGAWAGSRADGGYVGYTRPATADPRPMADGGAPGQVQTGPTAVRQPVPPTAFAMNTGAGGVYNPGTGGADVYAAMPNVLMAPDGGIATGMGDGSGIDDRIPAAISAGEYVIPADVVRKKGTDFFDKMIEKLHTPAAVQQAMIVRNNTSPVPAPNQAIAPMGQAPPMPAMAMGMSAPAMT